MTFFLLVSLPKKKHALLVPSVCQHLGITELADQFDLNSAKSEMFKSY